MAEIIGGGEPVNDAERAVIGHLRDRGPAHWVVLHNFELRLRDNRKYEIDVLVVTEYAVTLIDVKGTHGRIEVAGGRWYPANRQVFRSPVEKLRAHARALKGNLMPHGLGRVFVDALVVLSVSRCPADRPVSTGRTRMRSHVVTGLDDLGPRAEQARASRHRLSPRHPPVPGSDHLHAYRYRRAADGPAAVWPLGRHRVTRRDRGGHRVPRAER